MVSTVCLVSCLLFFTQGAPPHAIWSRQRYSLHRVGFEVSHPPRRTGKYLRVKGKRIHWHESSACRSPSGVCTTSAQSSWDILRRSFLRRHQTLTTAQSERTSEHIIKLSSPHDGHTVVDFLPDFFVGKNNEFFVRKNNKIIPGQEY